MFGMGDCKRGDRRVGPGEGVRERARRGDLGCPVSGTGGASREFDAGGGPLASSSGTDCCQGGGGTILSHRGADMGVDTVADGVGGSTTSDVVGAGPLTVVAEGEGGGTCDFPCSSDDCGVAGITFTRGSEHLPCVDPDVRLSTTGAISVCVAVGGRSIRVGPRDPEPDAETDGDLVGAVGDGDVVGAVGDADRLAGADDNPDVDPGDPTCLRPR